MEKSSDEELEAVVGGTAEQTAEFYAACARYVANHPEIDIRWKWGGEECPADLKKKEELKATVQYGLHLVGTDVVFNSLSNDDTENVYTKNGKRISQAEMIALLNNS